MFRCLVVMLVLLCSCSSKMKGKIEKRDDGMLYLVNTSETKIYRFTLEGTTIVDDSVLDYQTQFVTLFPGEVKQLGKEEYVQQLSKNAIDTSYTYPDGSTDEKLLDPTIPMHNFKFRYKVTGQIEIDPNKKQYFKD